MCGKYFQIFYDDIGDTKTKFPILNHEMQEIPTTSVAEDGKEAQETRGNLAVDEKTLLTGLQPIVIQPYENSDLNIDTEYLCVIKNETDNDIKIEKMAEGFKMSEDVDGVLGEGGSVNDFNANVICGIGETASSGGGPDVCNIDSSVAEPGSQDDSLLSDKKPTVVLQDCSDMLPNTGSVIVPSMSTEENNSKQGVDFFYQYNPFVDIGETDKQRPYNLVSKDGSGRKVAVEKSKTSIEQDLSENLNESKDLTSKKKPSELPGGYEKYVALTPQEKQQVAEFASKHSIAAAVQWTIDRFGKVVSWDTVKKYAADYLKNLKFLETESPKQTYALRPRRKDLDMREPEILDDQEDTKKSTVYCVVPKKKHDILNSVFSTQDQKDILTSALKIGIVPTARFYQNGDGKRPSESFVQKVLSQANQTAEMKEAKLSWINEGHRAEIRQFYKTLELGKRKGFNQKLKLVADKFSAKFNLAISVGTIAKILQYYIGQGGTKVKQDEVKLDLINEGIRSEIRDFYKKLDPRKIEGLNHRLEVVADHFSRKLNVPISAGTIAKILQIE